MHVDIQEGDLGDAVKKRSIVVIVCFMVLSVLLFKVEKGACKEGEVIITDAMGRVVTIKQPVQRVAYTGFCTTDALKIIGIWDRIKAREIFILNKPFYSNMDEIPPANTTRGDPYSLDFEKILTLDLDCLVTVKTPAMGFEEMNEKIKLHIPVVVLDLFDHDTTRTNFAILAEIFGKAKEAAAYMAWHDDIIQQIRDRTAKLTPDRKKRYFIKWSWGKVEHFSTMSDQFVGMTTINEIAGGINVAGDLKAHGGWVQSIDPEWLAEQDIDVIICEDVVAGGFGAGIDDASVLSSYRQQLMKVPFLAGCKAVKKNKVYMISPHFLYTPAFVVCLSYLAKWFHPELFPDLDPRAIHQEYLTRFIGVDFDLSKHGVFAYPEASESAGYGQVKGRLRGASSAMEFYRPSAAGYDRQGG